MANDIVVSIYCAAYNHEKYIEKTLNGFINQKTDFKYQVIVHDDASTDRTAEIIKKYDSAFRPLGIKTPEHYTDRKQSSGHLYITEIPGITESKRNEIITRMAQNDIACNVHYKPLPMHTAYKKLGFDIADYPNAYAHFAHEITLPLNTCLTDEMVDFVIENYSRIVAEYIRC